jgi:glyoxylase-like metal-dependent hydrolase (beta-lactamase superfamily II)
MSGDRPRRVGRRLDAPTLERIADAVWLMRGGFPTRNMNVYLIEDGTGVTVFDAGIRTMAPWLKRVGSQMGGIRRVVLSHSHQDHRGAAAGLDAPVLCHPAEVGDAQGDGGRHYADFSLFTSRIARHTYPWLFTHWDLGPVTIDGTVAEGDVIAGFEVKHFPGHAPGLIGLWRAADRLALVSDVVYTLDADSIFAPHGGPRVPHAAFTPDRRQAARSVRKLAALDPREVWTGHADPVTADVRAQLERAADEAEAERGRP